MDAVAQMESLQYMKDTEGWHLVEKHILEKIQYHKDQLITCSLTDVEKHRERVHTFESVLNYIEGVIEEGERELQGLPP